MEVISIERSAYEELQTKFNKFVSEMKAMASRDNDKRMGKWLDNQDVCLMLSISPRTLQTFRDNGTIGFSQVSHKCYYKAEEVERLLAVAESKGGSKCLTLKHGAYDRPHHAA